MSTDKYGDRYEPPEKYQTEDDKESKPKKEVDVDWNDYSKTYRIVPKGDGDRSYTRPDITSAKEAKRVAESVTGEEFMIIDVS